MLRKQYGQNSSDAICSISVPWVQFDKVFLVGLADLAQVKGHVLSVHLLGSHKIVTTIPRADSGILVMAFFDQNQDHHRTMQGRGTVKSRVAYFC